MGGRDPPNLRRGGRPFGLRPRIRHWPMRSDISNRWIRALFLRGVGLVYLVAFLSLIPQITGLIGEHGILPVHDYLDAIQSQFGGTGYRVFPTLAWLNSSDAFLRLLCWTGASMGAALFVGILPLPAAIVLYILYLSIDTAGQTFLSFQWDALLLEAGFAAILLAPWGVRPRYTEEPSRIALWVPRLLAFRLMLESGAVKLLSGDPTWRNLTALNFHYETQPLPTPLAWYAHHLPASFQKFSVGTMFVIELAVPFLFLMPRRLRIIGAWTTIVFQMLIAATGNYTFFNLLTIVLCLTLFDDRHVEGFLPARLRLAVANSNRSRPRVRIWQWICAGAGGILIVIGLAQLLTVVGAFQSLPEPLTSINERIEIFHIVNHYGLFAVMTTSRPEIFIEGSNDGQEWKMYEFKFKPGDIGRTPRWVAPFHPRLDWQMWFAALSSYRDNPWFSMLVRRLLEGSGDVLALFQNNPFPDKPPRFIRATVYDYHFSDYATRRGTGAWWTRQYLGSYFPAASLR